MSCICCRFGFISRWFGRVSSGVRRRFCVICRRCSILTVIRTSRCLSSRNSRRIILRSRVGARPNRRSYFCPTRNGLISPIGLIHDANIGDTGMGRPIIICTLLTKLRFQVEKLSFIAGNAAIRRVPRGLLRTVGNVLIGQRSIGVFLDELGHGNIAQHPSIDYQVGLHGCGLKVGIGAAVAGDYDVHGLGQKLLIGHICFDLVDGPGEGRCEERLPDLCQFVPDEDQIEGQHSPFDVAHLRACKRCEGSGGQLGGRDDAGRSDDGMTADHVQGIPVERILLGGVMINSRNIMIGCGVMAAREVGVQVESRHSGQHQTEKEERRCMVLHAKLFQKIKGNKNYLNSIIGI